MAHIKTRFEEQYCKKYEPEKAIFVFHNLFLSHDNGIFPFFADLKLPMLFA